MKKISTIILLAFVCGSFVMAQINVKKATLMPDGAEITNVKTGEVIRTTGAPTPISNLDISGVVSYTNNGETTTGNANQRLKPFTGVATTTLTPASNTAAGDVQKNIKSFNGSSTNTFITNPTSVGTVPPVNLDVVKPPVNSNQTITVD